MRAGPALGEEARAGEKGVVVRPAARPTPFGGLADRPGAPERRPR